MPPPMGFVLSHAPLCGSTSASRASARRVYATSGNPAGCSIGTSFRLCTARSMRPWASAQSSSLTNSPLPPTWSSVLSMILSPVVFMVISLQSPSARQTSSACTTARRLSRLPTLIIKFLQYRADALCRRSRFAVRRAVRHHAHGQPAALADGGKEKGGRRRAVGHAARDIPCSAVPRDAAVRPSGRPSPRLPKSPERSLFS